MKGHLLIRRIHLYLGLFLVIFFIKYGFSAIFFNHRFGFDEYYKDQPAWVKVDEIHCDVDVPENNKELRETGRLILEKAGFSRPFGVSRNSRNKLTMHSYNFMENSRLTYFIDEQRLLIENKSFRWDHYLHMFHWVGGYHQERFLSDAWAFIVDLVCLSIFIWIGTGIAMCWRVRSERIPGLITICGGFVIFTFLLIFL